jgi:hypothetical protein
MQSESLRKARLDPRPERFSLRSNLPKFCLEAIQSLFTGMVERPSPGPRAKSRTQVPSLFV